MNPGFEIITAKWNHLGAELGLLGQVTESRGSCPDGLGAYMHFEHGSIHWHPRFGAFETHGAIRNKWAELGWECSRLGYPTSDEVDLHVSEFVPMFAGGVPVSALFAGVRKLWQDGFDVIGRVSRFEHGSIYWVRQFDSIFVR